MVRSSAYVFVFMLLFVGLAAKRASGQNGRTQVDYVILIDVSGSMSGRPAGSGNVDIFPKVKDAIVRFVSELQPGSSVFITPFAETVEQTRRFDIMDSATAEKAETYVRSLQAVGSETHVYEAIGEAFRRYNSDRGSAPDRIGVILVFTDGLDNGPQHLAMSDVVRHFGLQRRENDFLYYATLGVNLPPGEAAALASSGFGVPDPSPAGDVHPVRVVQPRYGLLVFGNLQQNPDATRVLAMDVQGAIPPDFRLRARTSFPVLAQHGIYVEVTPYDLPAQDEVPMGLRLVNANGILSGDYDGTIQLESPDPRVIVVPRQIRAQFTYAPPRMVQVVAAPGRDRADIQLGRIDPFRSRNGRATVTDSLALEFDREAAARGGGFTVRVRQDRSNPTVLPSEAFRLNGTPGIMQTVDAARHALNLGIAIEQGQVRPGTYRGSLVLEDGSVQLKGPREIPWQFQVISPPISAGAIAALAALALAVMTAVALFVRYWVTGGLSAPLLKGRLTVREPKGEFGQEITLSGRREMTFGSGTSELSQAGARVRIVPERRRSFFRIKVVTEEGTVMIRRQGEAFDLPVASESLQDGDMITLPPYRLEYSRL
jgi:hypothetical protein